MIASKMVQLFSCSVFTTRMECNRAVAASQGISEAFQPIPEPPAAPAQLIIGPPAAQRDPQGQRTQAGTQGRIAWPSAGQPAIDQRLPQRKTPSTARHSPDTASADAGQPDILQIVARARQQGPVKPLKRVDKQAERQKGSGHNPLNCQRAFSKRPSAAGSGSAPH